MATQANERKDAVTLAWKVHKFQTAEWITQIINELSFADYSHKGIKLPEYERAVYLAASDLFDEDSESMKIITVAPAKVEAIRLSETYVEITKTLTDRVAMYRTAVANDEDWLRQEADVAKRVVSRNLRHGADSTRLSVAKDILDRQIPKKRREGEEDAGKVFLIFSENDGALLERAARIARKVMEPKQVGEKLLPAAPEP